MDPELAEWRKEWENDIAVPPDLNDVLRRKVERQSRWMRIMRLSEVLITVVFGGGTIAWALRSGEVSVFVLAALTWVSLILAWKISLTNTRGLWSPVAETNSEFLDLSIRRCQSQVRSSAGAAVLYLFNLSFALCWVYVDQKILPLGVFLLSRRVCVVWVVTLIFFVWLVWYRRAKQAELSRLLSLSSMLN
jgi:hypothetical protein